MGEGDGGASRRKQDRFHLAPVLLYRLALTNHSVSLESALLISCER